MLQSHKFSSLLKISRPRFWGYLAGTYLLGAVYGVPSASELLQTTLVLYFLWFTFPANFFVYGINDIFDYETDKLNPKKQEQEALVQPEEHELIKTIISIILTVGILLLCLNYSPILASFILVFYFLSFFYSAPPLRAKGRPFIDTLFNSLYIMPGLIAYYIASQSMPPLSLIIAGITWCMAMHAYSAIPDIEVDKEAHIATIATFLGKNTTLLFCTFLYTVTAFLVGQLTFLFGLLLTLYPLLMLFQLSVSIEKLRRYYWLFPWINMSIGLLLVLPKLWELAY